MTKKYTFTAKIKNARGGGAFVDVPFDVEKAFGSKRPKVKAMIGGVPYRGTFFYHVKEEVFDAQIRRGLQSFGFLEIP